MAFIYYRELLMDACLHFLFEQSFIYYRELLMDSCLHFLFKQFIHSIGTGYLNPLVSQRDFSFLHITHTLKKNGDLYFQ